MKIIGYITATGCNVPELDRDVNKYMDNGWQPFGNAYTHRQLTDTPKGVAENNPKFQPMVKYEESEGA